MRLAKYLSLGLCLVGGLLALWAGLHFSSTSIPFQDPTPEMLLQQETEQQAAIHTFLAAVGLMAIGLVAQAIIRRKRTAYLAPRGAAGK